MTPFSLSIETDDPAKRRWKTAVVDNPQAGQGVDEQASLPFGFAPGLDALLQGAADKEGERVRNQAAIEAPRYENAQGLFGESIPGFGGVVQPPKYNLQDGLLNSGINVDRDSFVKAYDTRERALNEGPMRSELGEDINQDKSASAFIQRSPDENYRRDKAAQDFVGNAILGATPIIGQGIALRDAGEHAAAAYNEADAGNYTKALARLGGAAFSLSGALPFGGAAERYGQEAAAANLGKRLPVLDREGNQVFGFKVAKDDIPTWEPAWRTPGAELNALIPMFGPKAEQAAQAFREGMPNRDIQKELGGVMAPDGVTRREIQDAGLPVNYGIRKGEVLPLEKVLPGHQELFDALPGLRDVRVQGVSAHPKYVPDKGIIHMVAQGQGVDNNFIKGKLFENVQTAIQEQQNLASSARHRGSFGALGDTAEAFEKLQGTNHVGPGDIPALAAYTGYLENYLNRGNEALKNEGPAAIGQIDRQLELESAGKIEKKIVARRALKEPDKVPEYIYKRSQYGDVPLNIREGLATPTPLNASDPEKLAQFLRNWHEIRK